MYLAAVMWGGAVDSEHAVEQMMLVKRIWNKTGGRQVRHFIVFFGFEEFLSPEECLAYGYQIAAYYADRFQIVFGIHYDAKNLHLHFAFNSVSYLDGKMYSGGYMDYLGLLNHIQVCMPQWRVHGVT